MPDEEDDISPDEFVEELAQFSTFRQPDPDPGPASDITLDLTTAQQPDTTRNWGGRIRAGGNLGNNEILFALPGGDVISSGPRYASGAQIQAQARVGTQMRAKTLDLNADLVTTVLKEKLAGGGVSLFACLLPLVGGKAFRVTAGSFGDRVIFVVDGNAWNNLLDGTARLLVQAERPGFVFGGEGVNVADVEAFIEAARERYLARERSV